MPSVDLDSPEHAICSHALERARETLTERTVSWHRAVKRAEKAEAEVASLRARIDAARTTDCVAATPVCMCCVEMIEALYPDGTINTIGGGS